MKESSLINLLPEIAKRIVFPKMSQMSLSVTYDCNQQCKTCGVWAVNKVNPKLRDNELKYWEIEKILDKNEDLMWITLTGGEPFIRKDIEEIIKCVLSKKNIRMLTMTTNGFSPDRIERIVKNVLSIKRKFIFILDVSLNGDKETHDFIAGIHGSHDHAVDTYRRLSNIVDKRLIVNYGVTLSKYNYEKRFVFDNLKTVINLAMNSKYIQKEDRSFILDDSQVQEVKINSSRSGIFGLLHKKYMRNLKGGKLLTGCVAGKYDCLVDVYGNQYNCSYHIGGKAVNLRDNDYKLARGNKTNECKGCTLACEFYPTMIFKPWRMFL